MEVGFSPQSLFQKNMGFVSRAVEVIRAVVADGSSPATNLIFDSPCFLLVLLLFSAFRVVSLFQD